MDHNYINYNECDAKYSVCNLIKCLDNASQYNFWLDETDGAGGYTNFIEEPSCASLVMREILK